MRIVEVQTLQADGGWRPFSFLKISTDAGVSGWSEFIEGPWSPALSAVIRALGRSVVGEDRGSSRLSAQLHAVTQFSLAAEHQAVAAIENACIDIAPACRACRCTRCWRPAASGGGLYWSHCGSFRVRIRNSSSVY
jgi:L-alanine-DL-glutamate epimerase-like enolase superfamily enzyme